MSKEEKIELAIRTILEMSEEQVKEVLEELGLAIIS